MNKEQTPKLEGTKEDTGFINLNHCDESCRVCGEVTHNVPTSRISLCASCGSEMFPCSGCNEACDGNCTWDKENFKCERFAYSQEWKKNYLQLSRVGFADTLAQLEDIRSQGKEWTIQDFEAKYNNAKTAIENIDRQLAKQSCDMYCSHCCNEVLGIPAENISLCPHCNAELFPCGGCFDENGNAEGRGCNGCTYDPLNFRCDRFEHTNGWKRKQVLRQIHELEEQLDALRRELSSPEPCNRLEVMKRESEIKERINELEQRRNKFSV